MPRRVGSVSESDPCDPRDRNQFEGEKEDPWKQLLGKSFLAYAVDTLGDTIPLIKIPRWDFRWQYFYTFKNL